MPRGSDYQGPPQALEFYAAVVDNSTGDSALKGAKNPYTARNARAAAATRGAGNSRYFLVGLGSSVPIQS